eukprot:SAG31_NODE_4040_length_3643_cov_3.306998_4_plen_170_part_00
MEEGGKLSCQLRLAFCAHTTSGEVSRYGPRVPKTISPPPAPSAASIAAWTAVVSSATPSPLAPKVWTSKMPAVGAAPGVDDVGVRRRRATLSTAQQRREQKQKQKRKLLLGSPIQPPPIARSLSAEVREVYRSRTAGDIYKPICRSAGRPANIRYLQLCIYLQYIYGTF